MPFLVMALTKPHPESMLRLKFRTSTVSMSYITTTEHRIPPFLALQESAMFTSQPTGCFGALSLATALRGCGVEARQWLGGC